MTPLFEELEMRIKLDHRFSFCSSIGKNETCEWHEWRYLLSHRYKMEDINDWVNWKL